MDELNDLLALFGDNKAAALELFSKSPEAQAALVGRETVYRAFSTGDEAELSRLSGGSRQQQQQTGPAGSSFLELAKLDSELDTRMTSRFKNFRESDDFRSEVKTTAKAIAEELFKSREAEILSKTIGTADEIYLIRSGHKDEFGKELDRKAFETFIDANPGKYGSLTSAHDAYVQEERLTARAKKMADDIVAAQQTRDVPGNSLSSGSTPLSKMIQGNKLTKAEEGRGPALDSATAAFRQLRQSQVN